MNTTLANPTTASAATPTKLGVSSKVHLRGIVPPLITPLSGRDSLDVQGLERLLEHVLAGGIQGLFILGTSGEGPGLSYRLRRELIERVCRQVKNRVPILVGITDSAFTEAVAMAACAANAGAQAVVTAGPFYLPAAQPELVDYVERLAKELPLPLFIYNMPQLTKVHFEPATLRRLAHLDKIIGLKDSSADLTYFNELLALKQVRPDWSVLVGPEHLLLETVRRGGDGGVNGGANFHPRLFVELFRAADLGDLKSAETLQKQLLQLGQIYSVGRHASAVVKGMKCACALMGLCDDRMAEPFERFHVPEREKVRNILKSLHLLPE